MKDNATAVFNYTNLSNGFAKVNGGAIMAEGNISSSILLSDCQSVLHDFTANSYGGFFYIDNPLLVLTI